MIPHAPHLSNDLSIPAPKSHINGMVDFVTNTHIASSPIQSSEVNVVHSTSSQQPGGKNKNKGKSMKYSNQKESTKTVDTQPKIKDKIPCMICTKDHYTKYFPNHEEVAKFLKCTSLPIVLNETFPTHQQQMVAQNHAPPQGGDVGHSHHGDASSSVAKVFMCKDTVSLMTKSKTYDTPPKKHANGGATDKPSPSTPPSFSTPL
jgi:hypothetical protein